MKKTLIALAFFGILIATGCSNEVRKENTNDTMVNDSTVVDTTRTM